MFLGKLDHYTTLEARRLLRQRRRFRTSDLTFRPLWTFFKLYVFKQGFSRRGRGLHVLRSIRGFGGGEGVEASRADLAGRAS